ncbi:MAG: hypothetical protein AAF366_05010, partial [Pseudomonadota bacterium]
MVDQVELEKIKLEAEGRKAEARYGFLKVVYGTTVVGVAAAFFPFASKYAESAFAERIEGARRNSEIAIAEREHDLALDRISQERQNEGRTYLESLSSEARSEKLGSRIIIAEFFSYLAPSEDERLQWAAFRDHLYSLQERLNDERAAILAVKNDENSSQTELEVSNVRLSQIEEIERPTVNLKTA